MKKFKKTLAMGLATTVILSLACVSTSAMDNLDFETKLTKNDTAVVESDVVKNNPGVIVLDGEVGDSVKSNGIIYEIVSIDKNANDEENPFSYDIYESNGEDNNIMTPRSSKVAFTIALSGTTRRQSFTLSGNYKFWKVWTQNTQSSGQTIITVEDSSGNTIGDVVYLPAGYTAQMYSDQDSPFPAGTYYVNYTSGNVGLAGTSSCRLATTWAELDVSE